MTRGDLRVTVFDVARAAGVSRATVTRALQGSGRIATDTRERILRVSDELGYVPNLMAAELAAGRTGTVGLMLRDASNPAYGLMFSELQLAARTEGIELVTVTIGDDLTGERQVEALRKLLGMRVAGLMVATGGVRTEQLLPFASTVPMIRVGRNEPGDRIHSIAFDEAAHGRMIAGRLLDLGHEHVVVLTTSSAVSQPEHARSRAARQALSAAGATVTESSTGGDLGDRVDIAVALARASGATAIVAGSDRRALEVLRTARAEGIDVPGDLSVTGTDGIMPGIDLLGLTSIRVPVEEVARGAVARMHALLENPMALVRSETRIGTLIEGTTAGATAGTAPRRDTP